MGTTVLNIADEGTVVDFAGLVENQTIITSSPNWVLSKSSFEQDEDSVYPIIMRVKKEAYRASPQDYTSLGRNWFLVTEIAEQNGEAYALIMLGIKSDEDLTFDDTKQYAIRIESASGKRVIETFSVVATIVEQPDDMTTVGSDLVIDSDADDEVAELSPTAEVEGTTNTAFVVSGNAELNPSADAEVEHDDLDTPEHELELDLEIEPETELEPVENAGDAVAADDEQVANDAEVADDSAANTDAMTEDDLLLLDDDSEEQEQSAEEQADEVVAEEQSVETEVEEMTDVAEEAEEEISEDDVTTKVQRTYSYARDLADGGYKILCESIMRATGDYDMAFINGGTAQRESSGGQYVIFVEVLIYGSNYTVYENGEVVSSKGWQFANPKMVAGALAALRASNENERVLVDRLSLAQEMNIQKHLNLDRANETIIELQQQVVALTDQVNEQKANPSLALANRLADFLTNSLCDFVEQEKLNAEIAAVPAQEGVTLVPPLSDYLSRDDDAQGGDIDANTHAQNAKQFFQRGDETPTLVENPLIDGTRVTQLGK